VSAQKGRDVVGVQPLNVAVAVLGLHHAGLYVASLERSIAFYREIFGLEVAERFDFGDEQLALLRVGNRRLELMQSPGVSSRASGVVDHVALQVDDLDAAIERLALAHVPLLDEAPLQVLPLRARILFCLGPDGERIELIEVSPSAE